MQRALYLLGIACFIQCSTQQSAGPYNAAVTSDAGQCSQMGTDILKKGGSAVDAAITSALCVGVINPQSSGIGGGLSMVVYSHDTQQAETLIAFEKAPLAATPDMFESRDASLEGVRTIAIPGELLGLWEAHKRFGRLPWADLFTPVIAMAENGFQVTSHLPYVVRILKPDYPFLGDMYSGPNGADLKTGDTIRAPEFAATLRKIADNGADEFYKGSIAADMLKEIKDAGGIITQDDFEDFDVEWSNVVSTTFKNDLTMHSAPLTSSGPTLQYILNILDEYDITSDEFNTPEKKRLLYHRFLEAGKFGHALRSHLGDDPTSESVENFLYAFASKDFAKHTVSLINDTHVTYDDRKGYNISINFEEMQKRDLDDDEEGYGDTAHVSVWAANGDAVSLTTSVGYYFGSKFYSNKTGVWQNNHMANFYFPTRESESTRLWYWPSPNGIAPGRRYMTTTCPSMLVDAQGNVKMVVGASGGSRIITTNAWVILRTLWMGVDLQDAVDEKRICNYMPSSNSAYYESRFPTDLKDQLAEMGHLVSESSSYAVCQAILKDESGNLDAYADARKGGHADAYWHDSGTCHRSQFWLFGTLWITPFLMSILV